MGWKPLIKADHDTLLLKNEAQVNCCSKVEGDSDSSGDSLKEALREAWLKRKAQRKRGAEPPPVTGILPQPLVVAFV